MKTLKAHKIIKKLLLLIVFLTWPLASVKQVTAAPWDPPLPEPTINLPRLISGDVIEVTIYDGYGTITWPDGSVVNFNGSFTHRFELEPFMAQFASGQEPEVFNVGLLVYGQKRCFLGLEVCNYVAYNANFAIVRDLPPDLIINQTWTDADGVPHITGWYADRCTGACTIHSDVKVYARVLGADIAALETEGNIFTITLPSEVAAYVSTVEVVAQDKSGNETVTTADVKPMPNRIVALKRGYIPIQVMPFYEGFNVGYLERMWTGTSYQIYLDGKLVEELRYSWVPVQIAVTFSIGGFILAAIVWYLWIKVPHWKENMNNAQKVRQTEHALVLESLRVDFLRLQAALPAPPDGYQEIEKMLTIITEPTVQGTLFGALSVATEEKEMKALHFFILAFLASYARNQTVDNFRQLLVAYGVTVSCRRAEDRPVLEQLFRKSEELLRYQTAFQSSEPEEARK